MRKNF